MPCTAAPFLIVLLCPIKQEAFPQDLCHITVPAAPQQSIKSMALLGMSTWRRIMPESQLSVIIMVSSGSQASKAAARGPGPWVLTVAISPHCQLWCFSVVTSSSKHALTSRRAGGTSTWCMLRKHILAAMKFSHRPSCVSKDTISGLSDVLLSSAQWACTWGTIGAPVEGNSDQGECDHNN